MEKKIAVISCILEDPTQSQKEFNETVSVYKQIVRGRMGIPFIDEGISVVSITVLASLDEINAFTGKLGSISNVQVKTAISKKRIND